MEERSEADKLDEVMLPGFRFHPTDEELVGFYLKRKVQHRPLSIELIKQLDIYKYDPWDLPKLATIGEKEWYFYCPRDRKYRNSTRPNRVTGAGFWKATGTDRPIYASEGSKCIGLKKSLVFYKGRAAKGIKTDWMMHEFRLPSLTTHKGGFIDKNIPANDSWAICRIFKKTNSSAQRTISQSWVSPIPETPTCESLLSQLAPQTFTNFNTSEKSTTPTIQFNFNNIDHLHQHSSLASFFPSSYLPSYNKPIKHTLNGDPIPSSFPFSSFEASSSGLSRCATTAESTSMYLNMFAGGGNEFANGLQSEEVHCDHGLPFTLPPLEMKTSSGEETNLTKNPNGAQFEDQWGSIRSVGIPFNNLPLNLPEAWKANLLWDSSSPCPSELSTSYSTNKCYS